MNRFPHCLLALSAGVLLSCAAIRAEDAAPDKPKTPAPATPKAPDTGRGGRGGRTFGQGGTGGMERMLGGIMGGNAGGGTGGVMGMVSRMLGFDIDDPKAAPKLEQLPLAANKRMVMQVPVGGVDNFNPTGAGWKMETVFNMTPDQTKATDTLRDDYAAEQKKLNQEIQDAEKALAAKVVDLRSKYEKKANDILTGPDKEAKEKMDALAADTYAKNAATVTETLPLYDTKDWQQGMTMVRALREKTGVTNKDAEEKLLALIPDANRPKFQDLMKAQAEQRSRANQFMQGGMFGNNGAQGGMRNRGQGGGDGGPVAPPKAPEGDKF